MVVDKLIEFYEKKISDYGLVYKHIPRIHGLNNMLTLMYFITAFIMLIGISYVIFENRILYSLFIPFLIILAILIIATKYEINRIIGLLEEKYRIYPEVNNAWKTDGYKKKQYSIFIGYLKRNKLYKREKLDKILMMLNDESEKATLPPLIAPGLLIAFVAPLWNYLIPMIFKGITPEGNVDLQIVVAVFVFLICSVVFVLLAIGIMQRMFRGIKAEFLEGLLWKRKLYRKELTVLLQDAILRFESEN